MEPGGLEREQVGWGELESAPVERDQVGWGLVREELESAPVEPEHRLHCHNQTESMLSAP